MSASSVTLHQGDIPASLSFGGAVAVDTESMGLHWERDRLCVIQLSSGDGQAHLVQFQKDEYDAPNLKKLLSDPEVVKIFHFARADLAVLAHYLEVMPQPVYCTKIASVLARTFTDRHGLKDLCRDLLGIELTKEMQASDWGADTLSPEQLNYAASDVLYLHRLRARLDEMLIREGRAYLADAAFRFLPARAALDLAGWAQTDIFAHKPVRS
ncbi:MAG: ribonuclease D [Alphaproteobacteria bacterium]|nr:ribonuclease D [Alphaproteobacteria bacterium]